MSTSKSYFCERNPSETTLLKKLKTKSGYCLRPQKGYPYLPLQKSLERLVKKEVLFINGALKQP